MTLNVVVASPWLLLCASDRRLTTVSTPGKPRRITTEQSTKLTQLHCKDAMALIAYNGIGRYQGATPADWLMELDLNVGLTRLAFKDVLNRIREDAETRVKALPKDYWPNPRHSFVVAAVTADDETSICVISNYENAITGETKDEAQEHFEVSVWSEAPGQEFRVLTTGSTQDVDPNDCMKILQVSKKPQVAGIHIKNLCVKTIQNASQKTNGKGSVGSSVLWAFCQCGVKSVEAGLDVRGGTTVQTMPNIIKPGAHIKDVRIEPVRDEVTSLTWGQPSPLPESQCANCKNPVPIGYKKCGSCGALMS